MESVNLPYYIRAERYDVLHDGGNVQPYSDLCVCVWREQTELESDQHPLRCVGSSGKPKNGCHFNRAG